MCAKKCTQTLINGEYGQLFVWCFFLITSINYLIRKTMKGKCSEYKQKKHTNSVQAIYLMYLKYGLFFSKLCERKMGFPK